MLSKPQSPEADLGFSSRWKNAPSVLIGGGEDVAGGGCILCVTGCLQAGKQPSGWPVSLPSHPLQLTLGSSQVVHLLGQLAKQKDPERDSGGASGGACGCFWVCAWAPGVSMLPPVCPLGLH